MSEFDISETWRLSCEAKTVTSNYTEEVKDKVMGLGADLVGIAHVEPLKELRVDPPDLLKSFTRAVSIALKLPQAVFEGISDRPTPISSQFTRQQIGP